MQEFKGTPGPWHVMRGDVLDKNGRMVASVEGVCPGENDTYDAELIASAPELLEALQLALNAMNEMGDILNFHDLAEQSKVDELTPAFDKARSAINKALGK